MSVLEFFKSLNKKLMKNKLASNAKKDHYTSLIDKLLESTSVSKLCLAHNNFESTPLMDNRDNRHDIYIHLEEGSNSYILHHDQSNTLTLVDKDYLEYQNSPVHIDSKSYEQKTIKHIIDNSIEELKKIAPKTSLNEDKSLEWLKVTLLTLKKSLSKIDHENTILSYKIFYGQWEDNPILRVIIYNLDIKLTFTNEALELIVKNKENRATFEGAKAYEAKFTSLHNEVLNEVINLFIKFKEITY